MKRITASIILVLLLGANAFAQFPFSTAKKNVEGYGHISFSEGTNYSFGTALVLGRQNNIGGFFIGAGAGLRYVHSVRETEELGDNARIQYYGGETILPVFVRVRIGRVRPMKLRPFLTADIGTVFNLDSEGNTRGFFFDPQMGLDITDNVYVTLGVDTHHFLSRSLVTISDVIGTVRDPEQKVRDIMSSGLTLHLGYSF